ncbi:hypothetical protein EYF80_038673 [Liparis tanakae]|uniref:Uncharacterized protein n=1 Tax=Liparis tanakae TaxID=230148 RepID=A0A4Z2GBZ2_9TELE|nr:hypothetical protein EYF80_038673 [Liparis tanakae]
MKRSGPRRPPPCSKKRRGPPASRHTTRGAEINSVTSRPPNSAGRRASSFPEASAAAAPRGTRRSP